MKHAGQKVEFFLSQSYDEDPIFNAINLKVNDILSKSFQSDNTCAYLPIEWNFSDEPNDGIGGDPVSDPLEIYVRIALSESLDIEPPTYAFNLRECVDEFIESCTEQNGFLHGEHAANAKKLSDAFRDLADKIDSKLSNGSLETRMNA